jgi:hypothetical protein
MTALFESIAMIVDQHQPVVEKYYGPGKMAFVIAKLMEECDRTIESTMENWEEERSVQRKVVHVSNYLLLYKSNRYCPNLAFEHFRYDVCVAHNRSQANASKAWC